MLLVIIVGIICYIIGSIPTGYLVGKIVSKIDIRKYGSGNIGATNVFRTLGVKSAIFVLIVDFMKGFVCAQFISTILVPTYLNHDVAKIICGLCAIIGHNWTIFLNFKGGKGVATTLGVFLALAPLEIGISSIVFLTVVLISKYVSLGSVVSSIIFSILLIIFKKPSYILFAGILATAFIIIRHTSNIKRILQGKENAIW